MTIISMNCLAQNVLHNEETVEILRTDEIDKSLAVAQIVANHPRLGIEYAGKVVAAASKASEEFNIPLNIVLAIAYVESSYKLNAVNEVSNDYGIMQVNDWHVKKSRLSKIKLMSDLDYSFYHGVRIFSWFYQRYPLDIAIGRYNCGTRHSCVKTSYVKKYIDKVKKSM